MKKLFVASFVLFFLAMTAGNTIGEFFWLKKPSNNDYIKDTYINSIIKSKQLKVEFNNQESRNVN